MRENVNAYRIVVKLANDRETTYSVGEFTVYIQYERYLRCSQVSWGSVHVHFLFIHICSFCFKNEFEHL